jgi:hypothetical protein
MLRVDIHQGDGTPGKFTATQQFPGKGGHPGHAGTADEGNLHFNQEMIISMNKPITVKLAMKVP